jgi:hypothetical protein
MSSPFRLTAPEYTLIMLSKLELITIEPPCLFCSPEVLHRHKHKLALTLGTKWALHTSPDSGSLLSWSSRRLKTLDQLHQPNQVIDAKLRSAPSDDLEQLRTINIRPACGYRPQAPAFIVEVHPVPGPVLAMLEDFDFASLPRMERVRDPTPPFRSGSAGCSRFMLPKPSESSLPIVLGERRARWRMVSAHRMSQARACRRRWLRV